MVKAELGSVSSIGATGACALLALALVGCGHHTASTTTGEAGQSTERAMAVEAEATAALPVDASALADSPESSAKAASDRGAASPRESFSAWLTPRLPKGGALAPVSGGEAPRITHLVQAGDTPASVAEAYLDLTDVYDAKDLAAMIAKEHKRLEAGSSIEIPHTLTEPYKEPDEDRIGWPKDKSLRGVFITGAYAQIRWVDTLDKLAARKLNAVVLDGKDYQGPVNYPTQVPVAVETHAYDQPRIPNLARAIRFAHARGILVIMRIPCFHDPWAAKHAPRLSLMGKWGGPFPMGWLDPTNEEAQNYMVALVEESIAAGADEIQLDYVRFPVQAQSIASAVMPKPNGDRSRAVRDFAHKVHEVTMQKHVPLSLDIFGVTATGDQGDIDKLGQDIATIGGEADALSPMVYPSEYTPGYRGFDQPGNHPEIIGIGTKAAVAKLKTGKHENTIVRPWLQASGYKSTNYGPDYLIKEAKSAEANGGVGWLLWNPGCDYWAAWRAFPVVN
jgi:hypothetical protein